MAINSTLISVNYMSGAAGIIGVASVMALLKYIMASQRRTYVPVLPKIVPPPKFSDSDADIVVIGGGFTGATIAARFGMDGRKVVMIEKNMGIDDTFRGEGLLPGGIHTLETLGMKDVLDEVDGNYATEFAMYDVQLGGKPAVVKYPEPGMLIARHHLLVGALRKKAMAQNSVTVIEGVGKELVKEKGRVVGVRYRRKGHDELEVIRAPLVIVSDGHYPHLSTEFHTTHKPVSESFVLGFLLKEQEEFRRQTAESGVGNPHGQIAVYGLNESEIRVMFLGNGPTPSDVNKYLEENVAPHVPDHIKESFLSSVKGGSRVQTVRSKTMAANMDYTPGVLVLGDAFNSRSAITVSGMTVALMDVCFWWNALSNVNDLSDDNAVCEHKLRFYKERLDWAFGFDVLAAMIHRLLTLNDETVGKLRQCMIKGLRSIPEETRSEPNNVVSGLFGGTLTDPEVVKNMLDGILQDTIQEIYATQPYIYAVWEAAKVKRKWNAIVKEVMEPYIIHGF